MNSRASVRCRTFGRVDVHELDRHTSYDPNQRPKQALYNFDPGYPDDYDSAYSLDISSSRTSLSSMLHGARLQAQRAREKSCTRKQKSTHAPDLVDIVSPEYVAHEPALHPQLDLSAPARERKRKRWPVSRARARARFRTISSAPRITPHRTFE